MKDITFKIITAICFISLMAGFGVAGSFYYYENYFAAPNIHVGTNSTTQSDLQRPLVSTRDITVYVNATGRNYTTIQEAINNVPYLLLHKYIIYVDDGDYNEDIVIPSMIVSDSLTKDEGAIYGLRIYGTSLDMNAVTVNSITISGVIGSNTPTISYMTVDDVEPRSDENVSISVYHSNQPQLTHLNITGNSKYAIMGYSSNVQVGDVWFNGQENGAFAKRGSIMLLGSSAGGLFGSLSSRLVIANSGWVEISNTSSLTVPQLVDCSEKGGVVSHENNELDCVDSFTRALDDLTIQPTSATYGLVINQDYSYQALYVDYDAGNGIYPVVLASNSTNTPIIQLSGGNCSAGKTGMFEASGNVYWCRAGVATKLN